MLSLTYAAAQKMLNTNQEQTAQSLKLGSGAPMELHLGQGPTAYVEATDAAQYLKPEHHVAGLNPVYRHLTAEGLKDLLKRGRFVITADED